MRWDGLTPSVENAGMDAPATSCSVSAASTSGTIYGDYDVGVRYVDDDGIPSNLSPLANIVITAGDASTTLYYTGIPTSSDDRVVGRQIWRNTSGSKGVTYYLDVEIDDNTATTSHSARTDGTLRNQTALRKYTADGFPNANRFNPPPHHMSVVVSYSDRMWYSVPVDYKEGGINYIASTSAVGGNMSYTDQMIGRYFFVAGKKRAIISAVNDDTLTLSTSQAVGFGDDYKYYSVTVEDDERNCIYFSEPNEPEAFGGYNDDDESINKIVLQEDGDHLTGLMPAYGYLYLLKQKHIYRLGTAGDPRNDASVSLVAGRGCLNQRCWCEVEGSFFIMDNFGAYVFDGSATTPISASVQDFFRGRINWRRSKWFHVSADTNEEVVRFFVALDGADWPRHALCFHYRLGNWWQETYPFNMGDSASANVGEEPRLIAGADDSVMLMNEGVLDGPAPRASHRRNALGGWEDGTVHGTVTDSSFATLSDSSASYDFTSYLSNAGVEGAPITVISATDGSTQTRRIASVDSTNLKIEVDRPWGSLPKSGDTYRIGGIPWQIKLGGFRYLDEEREQSRSIRVMFKPITDSATVSVRKYHDHSSTASTSHETWTNDDNVSFAKGSANANVDLTWARGSAVIGDSGRIMGDIDTYRVVDVELTGVSATEQIEIYGLELDGVEE